MKKHTPGPWKFDDAFGLILADNGKVKVAACHAGRGADSTANAALIAAAPDMLAALKLVWRTQGHILGDHLRLAITDAIAKAEGRDHE